MASCSRLASRTDQAALIGAPSPDVSVVIATRNRWGLLPRALDSALRQEAISLEVIVVDDGSDEPRPPIEETDDPRVTVVRHERQRGPSAARNTGTELAGAPWVAFLDDDDIWAPRKLVTTVETARGAGADFCYSSAVLVDTQLRVLGLQPAPSPDGLLRELLQRNAIPGGGSNVVTSASLLRQAGGYDESLSFGEDWDLWIRLAERARPAAIHEVMVAYSHNPGGSVLGTDLDIRGSLERLADKHREAAQREGVAVDMIGHERYLAYSQHLAGRRGAAAQSYLSIASRHRDPRDLGRAAASLVGMSWLARLGIRGTEVSRPEWLDRHAQRKQAAT